MQMIELFFKSYKQLGKQVIFANCGIAMAGLNYPSRHFSVSMNFKFVNLYLWFLFVSQ